MSIAVVHIQLKKLSGHRQVEEGVLWGPQTGRRSPPSPAEDAWAEARKEKSLHCSPRADQALTLAGLPEVGACLDTQWREEVHGLPVQGTWASVLGKLTLSPALLLPATMWG